MKARAVGELRPWLRKFAGAVVIVLAIALPVLLAFTNIDAPATKSELRRVEHTLFPERGNLSEAARMFYGSTVPESALTEWPTDRENITIGARLSGMLALFVISALVYFLLAQVRGRVTGIVGSLSLSALPPIAGTGYILRPELGASMFGLLGIVLLIGLPVMLRHRRGLVSVLTQGCLIVVVGMVMGLAMAVHDQAWIYLAVPALALMLSVLALLFLLPRAIRGRPIEHWPLRAAARRYMPWMFTVLICSSMALLVLTQSEGVPDHSTRVRGNAGDGLLPGSLWLAAPLWGFALVGAARMGYGVSLRIQRLRRLRPDTVMFLYVAALMTQSWLGPAGVDQLPAAAAMACLLGDGVVTAVVLVMARAGRHRG